MTAFASVILPTPEEMKEMDISQRIHAIRRIQIYWAILKEAGFATDETKLTKLNYMYTSLQLYK